MNEEGTMSKSPLESRIAKTNESRRVFAQEELILDVSEKLLELMEKKTFKKTDLAKVLNRSGAYLTQILDGSRNMTLRTLSDLAFAMKSRVHIDLHDAYDIKGWHFAGSTIVGTVIQQPEYLVPPANNENIHILKLVANA